MNHTHGHSSPRRDAEAEANACASAGNPLLGTPDFDALRTRAHNLRWATVAADVIPLTAADPDLPVASPIIDAITAYVRTPHLSYGPAAGIPEFGAAVARHFKTTKDATVASARVIDNKGALPIRTGHTVKSHVGNACTETDAVLLHGERSNATRARVGVAECAGGVRADREHAIGEKVEPDKRQPSIVSREEPDALLEPHIAITLGESGS